MVGFWWWGGGRSGLWHGSKAGVEKLRVNEIGNINLLLRGGQRVVRKGCPVVIVVDRLARKVNLHASTRASRITSFLSSREPLFGDFVGYNRV